MPVVVSWVIPLPSPFMRNRRVSPPPLGNRGKQNVTIRAGIDRSADIQIAGIDRLQRSRRALQFADACAPSDQEQVVLIRPRQ